MLRPCRFGHRNVDNPCRNRTGYRPATKLRNDKVIHSAGPIRSQYSRRDFLGQTVASATTLLASACDRPSAEGPAAPGFDVIDVHIHADFNDATLVNQGHEISGVDFSPAGLAAEMAANRVIHACAMGWETGRAGISRASPIRPPASRGGPTTT